MSTKSTLPWTTKRKWTLEIYAKPNDTAASAVEWALYRLKNNTWGSRQRRFQHKILGKRPSDFQKLMHGSPYSIVSFSYWAVAANIFRVTITLYTPQSFYDVTRIIRSEMGTQSHIDFIKQL